jgi:hypothetical protein
MRQLPPPKYINFEVLKERHGRKMLATQERLNIPLKDGWMDGKILRQAMAPPILHQAALEESSSRQTVTAEQTATQV